MEIRVQQDTSHITQHCSVIHKQGTSHITQHCYVIKKQGTSHITQNCSVIHKQGTSHITQHCSVIQKQGTWNIVSVFINILWRGLLSLIINSQWALNTFFHSATVGPIRISMMFCKYFVNWAGIPKSIRLGVFMKTYRVSQH